MVPRSPHVRNSSLEVFPSHEAGTGSGSSKDDGIVPCVSVNVTPLIWIVLWWVGGSPTYIRIDLKIVDVYLRHA